MDQLLSDFSEAGQSALDSKRVAVGSGLYGLGEKDSFRGCMWKKQNSGIRERHQFARSSPLLISLLGPPFSWHFNMPRVGVRHLFLGPSVDAISQTEQVSCVLGPVSLQLLVFCPEKPDLTSPLCQPVPHLRWPPGDQCHRLCPRRPLLQCSPVKNAHVAAAHAF